MNQRKSRPYHSATSSESQSDSISSETKFAQDKERQVSLKSEESLRKNEKRMKNTEGKSGDSSQNQNNPKQLSENPKEKAPLWDGSVGDSLNNSEAGKISEMNSFCADQVVHPAKHQSIKDSMTETLEENQGFLEPLSVSRSNFESNSYAASESYASAYLSSSYLVEMVSINETISYEYEEEMSPSFVQLYNCQQEQEFFCSPRASSTGNHLIFLNSSSRKSAEKKPNQPCFRKAEETNQKKPGSSDKDEEDLPREAESSFENQERKSGSIIGDDNESKAEAIMSQLEPSELCVSIGNSEKEDEMILRLISHEEGQQSSRRESPTKGKAKGEAQESKGNEKPAFETHETLFKKKVKPFDLKKPQNGGSFQSGSEVDFHSVESKENQKEWLKSGLKGRLEQGSRGSHQAWQISFTGHSNETRSLEFDEESECQSSSASSAEEASQERTQEEFSKGKTDGNSKDLKETSTKEESESQKMRKKIEMVQEEQLSNAIESIVYENEEYFSERAASANKETEGDPVKEALAGGSTGRRSIDDTEVLNSILRKENEALRRTASDQAKQLELYRETFRELKVQAV